MKKLLFLILLFCSTNIFAQGLTLRTQPQGYLSVHPVGRISIFKNLSAKSDTLEIPIGKYKFIKVGDKVYKIEASLVEVKEEGGLKLWNGGIGTIREWNDNMPLNPTYSIAPLLINPNY